MNRHGDNLAALFVSAVRHDPDRVFLRWCGSREPVIWTYREAARRIADLVQRMANAGVGHDDAVVIYTDAMVPSIVFDVACACAGVRFTPIETTSLPAVLELCQRTDARVVLTTPDRQSAIRELAVVVEDGLTPCSLEFEQAIELLSERAAHVRHDSVYMLQPTSGTTGLSKLVVRTHATFVRVGLLWAFGEPREATPQRRTLIVPALTHGMGQYLLASALWSGAELDVTSEIDVRASIDEIRAMDPTFITLTPRVLASLVRQLGGATDRIFGPSLKYFISSGARPDAEVLAAIQRSGVTVIEAFGASECSMVAMTRPGRWRPDILGHVLDDVEVRVSETSELHVRSAYAMTGYHGQPELTKAAFADDGYYRTGDRVTLGPDGELVYQGRLVESFNLFDGSHVTPFEIEEAMALLPWLDQVLLIGDQRPYVTALVVPLPSLCGDRSGSFLRMIERDVGRICSALPPNARVRRLAILDQRLSTDVFEIVGHGKIRRRRADAQRLHASLVQALYGDAPGANAVIVDVPGGDCERRTSTRHPMTWLLRIDGQVARTTNVSRTGALVEHDGRLASSRPLVVEVLGVEGLAKLEATLVREHGTGSVIVWTGPPEALTRLTHFVPP